MGIEGSGTDVDRRFSVVSGELRGTRPFSGCVLHFSGMTVRTSSDVAVRVCGRPSGRRIAWTCVAASARWRKVSRFGQPRSTPGRAVPGWFMDGSGAGVAARRVVVCRPGGCALPLALTCGGLSLPLARAAIVHHGRHHEVVPVRAAVGALDVRGDNPRVG